MSALNLFAAAPRQRIIPPIPADRPSARLATSKLIAALTTGLALSAAAVAAEIRRKKLQRLYRLDDIDLDDDDQAERQADQIARSADLSALDIVPAAALAFGLAALDVAARQIDRLNQSGDLLQFMPDAQRAALDLAQSHAAEMVTGISETTRGMIRDIIVRGIATGQTTDQIADTIGTGAAFGPERAQLIATTEMSSISNGAALSAMKLARDKGHLPLRKQWLLGNDPCIYCEENGDDGPIDIDDLFSSGDDAPPLHPNCYCSIAAVIGDE